MTEDTPAIDVQLTDESELHCLKIIFRARNEDEGLQIFLHTTQAVELQHKLSLAICQLHHRDSEMLLQLKRRAGEGRHT